MSPLPSSPLPARLAAHFARGKATLHPLNAPPIEFLADTVSVPTEFVNLCIEDGLATVTGTVAVGASTSSLPRTLSSAPASVTRSTSIPTTATYEPTIAAGTATQVASLVVSGAPTSSGTGSVGAAAAASSSKPATAGRTAASLALMAVAGAAVLVL